MESFYKITKAEAALMGKFEYAPNQAFDPFVGEQIDGAYLVSEQSYSLLKERMEIKKVDFTKCAIIKKDEVNLKLK